jgi:hypothetical protein
VIQQVRDRDGGEDLVGRRGGRERPDQGRREEGLDGAREREVPFFDESERAEHGGRLGDGACLEQGVGRVGGGGDDVCADGAVGEEGDGRGGGAVGAKDAGGSGCVWGCSGGEEEGVELGEDIVGEGRHVGIGRSGFCVLLGLLGIAG